VNSNMDQYECSSQSYMGHMVIRKDTSPSSGSPKRWTFGQSAVWSFHRPETLHPHSQDVEDPHLAAHVFAYFRGQVIKIIKASKLEWPINIVAVVADISHELPLKPRIFIDQFPCSVSELWTFRGTATFLESSNPQRLGQGRLKICSTRSRCSWGMGFYTQPWQIAIISTSIYVSTTIRCW
jgi:hypothetical protein